jgi:hypothetical protein
MTALISKRPFDWSSVAVMRDAWRLQAGPAPPDNAAARSMARPLGPPPGILAAGRGHAEIAELVGGCASGEVVEIYFASALVVPG